MQWERICQSGKVIAASRTTKPNRKRSDDSGHLSRNQPWTLMKSDRVSWQRWTILEPGWVHECSIDRRSPQHVFLKSWTGLNAKYTKKANSTWYANGILWKPFLKETSVLERQVWCTHPSILVRKLAHRCCYIILQSQKPNVISWHAKCRFEA